MVSLNNAQHCMEEDREAGVCRHSVAHPLSGDKVTHPNGLLRVHYVIMSEQMRYLVSVY